MKIALVHNKIRDYRIPLFELLAEKYDIEFLIFEEDTGNYPFNVTHTDKKGLFNRIVKTEYDIIILPDYVFLESWISALAAIISGSDIIGWTEVWDMPHTSILKKCLKQSMAFGISVPASSMIVPGKRSKNFITSNSTLQEKDIHVAPNAPNLPQFNRSKSQDKFEFSGHTILYLGQLVERKRVQDIIVAVENSSLEDITLLIAGSGNEDYESFLKQIPESKSVKFLGWVPDHDIPILYNLADIYILPSLRDPFPLTVVEAMSTGTPVIISAGVGEAGDLVQQGETGEIVSIKSPEEIRQSMEKILTNDQYFDKLSNNCKEVINKRATFDNMIKTFADAIDKVSQ